MKTYINPERKQWSELAKRPAMETDYLRSTIQNILDGVKKGGDKAIIEFTERFDGVKLDDLEFPKSKWENYTNNLPAELKKAIQTAANNIKSFHQPQLNKPFLVETMPGVKCWRKPVAIEKVGLYIPGGTAPLFSSVLMMAIPAQIAGCKETILCTPPDKNGNVHPAIVYAALITNVDRIFLAGGAQAIAAMAFGTETIPKTDKIYGPGNQFVTTAKQMVSEQGVAIDMPAGPSEVLVLADTSANPDYIAADLLSQAEHGADSQVILSTNDPSLSGKVNTAIENQIAALPRKEVAQKALLNSKIVVFEDFETAIDFSNTYAPEHLIIQANNLEQVAEKINHAGSVFLGPYTPESAGDYASGTNHTLPTNGYARAFSGLSVESFVKYITFQEITREGLENIGDTIEIMAKFEELDAHKNAVSIRRKS
ncbi:MAG: histidinol dehydrogenase [Cyclobacteriaceae bacterium]|nr:histidinol dehydrogenase [Cyclobacteriaceae bacterium]